MSRIDTLLEMVDSISARSDKLVGSVDESHKIILLIAELNTSISRYDTEIDAMSQLATRNNVFLAEFQKLYERSFYLELNFALNECYTNDTSFSNLYSEYEFLCSKFRAANAKHVSTLGSHTAQDAHVSSPMKEKMGSPEKMVKNIISISNLHLKPLRCKDSKVQKQKSRYRLSEAYTLNPLQGLPTREVLESSAKTKCSNIMSALSLFHNHEDDSSFFSHTSISGLPVSLSHRSQLSSTPQCLNSDPKAFTDPFHVDRLPLLFKSPCTLDLEVDDMEDSGQLDCEVQSQDSRFEDFDNFHHFLRRSRMNLKECFPEPLERARSHDSVLTVKHEPLPIPLPQRKFHNPADMVNAQKKSLLNQPTLEAIYSKKSNATSKFKEHSAKLLASQSDSSSQKEAELPVLKNTPKFDLFKLMNSPLGSPRGLDRSRIAERDQENTPSPASPTSNRAVPRRRKSLDIFGSSFTSTFMNLVNASPSLPPLVVAGAEGEIIRPEVRSPPERIKKLKKDLKNPISLRNDIKSKRLPPMERQLQNGGGSFLTIGPNKTKVINHGVSSAFKKPTLRRMSQTLLTDALNESLLF